MIMMMMTMMMMVTMMRKFDKTQNDDLRSEGAYFHYRRSTVQLSSFSAFLFVSITLHPVHSLSLSLSLPSYPTPPLQSLSLRVNASMYVHDQRVHSRTLRCIRTRLYIRARGAETDGRGD